MQIIPSFRIFGPSDIFLILTTILSTLLFQMAAFFYIKWRKYDKKLRLHDQFINFSMFFFFLFSGISNVINMSFDLGEITARLGALKIELIFFVISSFSLIYTLMKILEIKHKKIYLSTFLASIILIIISQRADHYIWYYSIISSILVIIIIYFIYKMQDIIHGKTKRKLIPIAIGLLIFSTTYIRNNLSIFLRELFSTIILDDLTILNLGKLFDIFGMLLISLGFYTVEFAELKWKGAIQDLLVINQGGICLYYYPFIEKTGKGEGFDQQLAAGAIMGIQSILGEILDKQKSKTLETIDYQGKKLLFKKGEYVSTILISESDLIILHDKLGLLIQDIENNFKESLEKNITRIDLYEPISYFIEEIFNIKKKSKRKIFLNP